MALIDLLGLVIRPLGVVTYIALASTFVLGGLMMKRKAKLPAHRAAARIAIVFGSLHAGAVILRILLR